MTEMMSFHSEILEMIRSKQIADKKHLHNMKIKLCRKHNLKSIPPDSEILSCIPSDWSDEEVYDAQSILRKKPMRTVSGVAIIAVMTSPSSCPHGCCLPCPGGPSVNTPQSYTGYEPAARRAASNNYDPYEQTMQRLKQLECIGHATSKVDLIIMGGTFTARDLWYQEWFVKRCFDALNGYTSKTLEDAQSRNEASHSRCIGLTVETRPDWFRLQHVDNTLRFGATRVELGVQTVYDDTLHLIRRGHTVQDSINATFIAKNSGFKVCYHMMPGLPGMDEDREMDSFMTVFNDQRFKPDMIKIYPTLTVQGTKLYELWRKGEYEPLTTDEAARMIARIKTIVPEWVRIQRIQRDIPVQYIASGVSKSNLRQIVKEEMEKQGVRCRCIRCREVGHHVLSRSVSIEDDDIMISSTKYEASGSDEVFISITSRKHDVIIGYLRLRDILVSHRYELTEEPCMIIREVKILGRELPFSERRNSEWQHKGFGRRLISEAERICTEEYDKKRLFVLSGVGVKPYYRRLGFKDYGVYLVKSLT